MPSTSKVKKEIESKCFKFIWNGKPDKVNRNTLIGDFEKDELKMIAVDSYFLIKYWFVVFPPFLSDQLYVAYGYVVVLQIVLSPVLEHNDKQICGTAISEIYRVSSSFDMR
jgi:hypothetical protein